MVLGCAVVVPGCGDAVATPACGSETGSAAQVGKQTEGKGCSKLD
jgi:hypothetical protein